MDHREGGVVAMEAEAEGDKNKETPLTPGHRLAKRTSQIVYLLAIVVSAPYFSSRSRRKRTS